jgi:hypothetical protein
MVTEDERARRYERTGKSISTIFLAVLAVMFAYGYLGWIVTG